MSAVSDCLFFFLIRLRAFFCHTADTGLKVFLSLCRHGDNGGNEEEIKKKKSAKLKNAAVMRK